MHVARILTLFGLFLWLAVKIRKFWQLNQLHHESLTIHTASTR